MQFGVLLILLALGVGGMATIDDNKPSAPVGDDGYGHNQGLSFGWGVVETNGGALIIGCDTLARPTMVGSGQGPTMVGSRLYLGRFLRFPFEEPAGTTIDMQRDCGQDTVGGVPTVKLNNRQARKHHRWMAKETGKGPMANLQVGDPGMLGIPS
ncbi:hypothetical protein NE237_031589 [Protea cynaroides]|uniref:Uncharacterized protein n=1 Tax=Protea cynaroides TaxID=273540 RepID=A0A9Q0L1G5_9MAGN|nr:hypothetical protein NE237_031589 [Protea cynaroides]